MAPHLQPGTVELVGGVALGSAPVIAANATTLALNGVLMALKLRHGR